MIDSQDEGVLSDGVDGSQMLKTIRVFRGKPKEGKGFGENLEAGRDKRSLRGRIVIMKPEGEKAIINKFMGSSVQLARLLDSSKFKEAGIGNVRSNFKMKYLTIEAKNDRCIPELLKITKMGEYQIKCSQPVSHIETKGVIGPIGVFNGEDIKA